MNATRELWLIVAHDLLEYMQIRWWHHGKTVFFLLLNMAHRFENDCVLDYFGFGRWKQGKNYQELFTKKKNGEMEAKRVLDHVENVYKLQEIFTTVIVIIVSSLQETCCFEKCFRTLFCFEQEKTSKTLRSNCTQVRWRKKKNKRRQVYNFGLKDLCSNRSQRTSKCGTNISDTLACGSCATSFFTTFWCHLWSITEQIHGNPSTCR